MPPPAKVALDPEAARKRADQMQAYRDYAADRPNTSMTHDEQVADFSRRHQAARSSRILALARARSQQMQADREAGTEQSPAGSYFKERALKEAGDLGKAGQGVRSGAQKVLDVTDTTLSKGLGMGGKVALGGDVRGIVQNTAVLGDLTGQTMTSKDAKITRGYEISQERNAASSDDLASKVTGLQSAAKGTTERKKAALAAFQSAGVRARDQAELGAYQDLKMKTGPEEYSKDEVLGKAAPDVLGYDEGDVVDHDDTLHGSKYGTFKRALQTGSLSQSGKLSTQEKADVGRLQQELDDEQAARKAEHEGRDAGTFKGQAKRFVMMQGSKLTDAEKTSIEDIQGRKADHERTSKQTEAQLKADKDAILNQVKALKSQQPIGPLLTDARKAKHADLQKQIEALQPSLEEGRKKLADHRASMKAASEEFDGQVSDIHARANGGFTRAETAARQAKQDEIAGIRTGATAAQAFTSKHAGETINHYGRVGGMIDRMEDPAKMEATRAGTIADYANKGFEHVSDAGKIVGGSADDARDLQEQGKYLKSGATAAVGIGMETAKLAGASVGVGGHIGDGAQKVISSGLKGVGAIGGALTAEAAAEERERTHSRDVVEGRRREQLKTSSFITTRQPSKEEPTVLGGVGELVKGVLGADAVKDAITDGVGLGDDKEAPAAAKEEAGGDSSGPEHEDAAGGGGDVPVVHEDAAGGGGDVPVVHEDAAGGGGDVPVVHEDAAGGGGDVPVVHEDAAGGGGDVPVVHEDAAGGGGDAPVVHEDAAGGGGDVPVEHEDDAGGGVGPEDGPAADEQAADKPEAEAEEQEGGAEEDKPESFEDKVKGNAQDEAYEQLADGAVDKGADKAGAVLAGPVAAPKPDAPVPAAVPTPGPGQGQRLPWWKRLWNAVKRGARAVGRGVVRAGRAVGRGIRRVGRAIGHGFRRAGSWVRGLFRAPRP